VDGLPSWILLTCALEHCADAKAMAAMGDEFHCPDILRRCDDFLSSSAGVSAARLEALTGGPGTVGTRQSCTSQLPCLEIMVHSHAGPLLLS
jgi:hypothetical protein